MGTLVTKRTKRCFKCHRDLPRSEFYRHKAMGDGLLGKCKECAKKDVRANYSLRRAQYSAYDIERAQRPERKAAQRRYSANKRVQSPEKYKARTAVGNAVRDGRLTRKPCEDCGSTVRVQAHHHDYSKPLDIRWLCFKCHREHEHGQTVTRVA